MALRNKIRFFHGRSFIRCCKHSKSMFCHYKTTPWLLSHTQAHQQQSCPFLHMFYGIHCVLIWSLFWKHRIKLQHDMSWADVIVLGWGMLWRLETASASTFIYNNFYLRSPHFVRLLGAFECNILLRFKACTCHKRAHKKSCFEKPTFIFWSALDITLEDQSVCRSLHIQTNSSFQCW